MAWRARCRVHFHRAKIERIQIENYKSIAQVDVPLGPLTVLVGRNGAGKSTFLDVFRFLRDSLRFNLETAIDRRGGMADISRWTPRRSPPDISISLDAHIASNEIRFELALTSDSTHGFRIKRERARLVYLDARLTRDDHGGPIFDGDELHVVDGSWVIMPSSLRYDPETRKSEMESPHPSVRSLNLSHASIVHEWPSRLSDLSYIREFLSGIACYALFPNTLRPPQKPTSDAVLSGEGENLGAVLKQILMNVSHKRDIVASLNRLVPDVVDVRVKPVGGYLVTQLKHESTGRQEKWFELERESDGTLRMLGLLVALYQDPAPKLIAIEEPELTIHPGALAVLADVIREASLRAQVLITTQSADLVSHFHADELRVDERVNGDTEIGTLDSTQREAIARHLFDGGELMRMEGLRREAMVGGGGA